jgi:replication initiation and membrane attachment protein DnaB
VDHRLVRDRYIEMCGHSALALYLFLVTVGDAKGLSYYSDISIMQRLSMNNQTLNDARKNLIETDLIAYQAPIYQILGFDSIKPGRRPGHPVSLKEIFKQAGGMP